ncbi:hypothetical protein CDD83_6468 [Cordyceps sp. RAO-2017]|nr:hypothetical protein CDD83_6468 [Cordyceps sp. RAO-2017]
MNESTAEAVSAASISSWPPSMAPSFQTPDRASLVPFRGVWRAAFVEAVAMTCFIFATGQITATLSSYDTKQQGAYSGIGTCVISSLSIYAIGAATGGQINPMITFSAVLAGLCPVSRGVLYMCGQTIGAALASGILTGVWGRERLIRYPSTSFLEFRNTSLILQGFMEVAASSTRRR